MSEHRWTLPIRQWIAGVRSVILTMGADWGISSLMSRSAMGSADSDASSANGRVDANILIFVAFDRERDAILKVARAAGFSPTEHSDVRLGKYRHVATIRGRRVVMVRAVSIGAIGAGASAGLALRWLAETGATTVIQVGMAFGVDPASQKRGDVLVAETLFPYDIRVVSERSPGTPVVEYTGMHMEASREFLTHLESAVGGFAQSTARVHRGPILTGNTKVFSTIYRNELAHAASRPDREIIGGEMEGLGLLAASSPNNPNWNLVKGISDFADGEEISPTERDHWRDLACQNAAALVFDVLGRYPDNT